METPSTLSSVDQASIAKVPLCSAFVQSHREFVKFAIFPAAWYAYTGTVIMALVLFFAYYFVIPTTMHTDAATRVDVWSVTAAWDGQWYRRIATGGYWYRENREGPAAFFPLYPLLAAGLIHGASVRPEMALLLVSNVSLFIFCGLFHYDLVKRQANSTPKLGGSELDSTATWSVVALLCFPMSFFLRAGYSESLFLLISFLSLWGMRTRWPILAIALLIGLATACRLVGIALIIPFWWHLWSQRRSAWSAGLWMLASTPLTLGGLIAFMVHLNHVCGNPFAFMEIQSCWSLREPGSFMNYLMAYVSLAPLREVYQPDSVSYWMHMSPHLPILNARFLAPILFLWVLGCVLYGMRRRWLTIEESLYSLLVIGIPFLTQGYRICMNSQGRYALLAFPAFMVMGYGLARMPRWISLQCVIASAVLMVLLSALFAAWYPVY